MHEAAPGDLKIQLASDLHLEGFKVAGLERFQEILRDRFGVGEDGTLPAVGDCLALLGDIGYPTEHILHDFLLQQASRFRTVLFLPGNHEYYV